MPRIRCFSPLEMFVVLLAGVLATSHVEGEGLKPTENDRKVAQEIVQMLDTMHLTKQRVDDRISQRAFDTYLRALDPQKLYFLRSDAASFATARDELDDRVRKGELEWAFEVYARFLVRVNERVERLGAIIDADHDFTVDETMRIDRKHVEPAATADDLDEVWRRRIKYMLLEKKADGETLEEARRQLKKRYASFAQRMGQTDNDELLQIFLSSITTAFDPHTTYMSAGTLENFEITMRLELEGIGASLRSEDGYTIVNEVIDDGAAHKDGRLKPEDKIVAVGQGDSGSFEDVVEQKLSDVVKLIRGKKGTVVRLKVQRPAQKETQVIKLTRARVELKDQEAQGEVFEQGLKEDGNAYKVGVIDLPSFYMDMSAARRRGGNYKSTTRDVFNILHDFKIAGVDAVVVDLRGNGGGALAEAIDLTGLFVNQGPVVQVKNGQSHVDVLNDEVLSVAWGGPLVVLTNKFSASASEIFAGAIQDYRRGLIVGDTSTHGKGTVQTLEDIGRRLSTSWRRPLRLGALKITRQQFYRPSGGSTQNRGIVPDLILPSVTNHGDVGEASLDYALPFDRVEARPFVPAGDVSASIVNELTRLSEERRLLSEKFQEVQRDIHRYLKYKDREFVPLAEGKFMAEYTELHEGDAKPGSTADGDTEKEASSEKKVRRNYYLDEALAITVDFIRLGHGVGKVAN